MTFLEYIDSQLRTSVPQDDVCVFNIVDGMVDGYAVEEVATVSACDFLYSEIWFAIDTYESVRAYIEQLRELGGGRAVVLAVYPQYGEDVGTILEDPGSASDVLFATPDEGTGAFAPIPTAVSEDHIELTVPRLEYWGMVLLKRS